MRTDPDRDVVKALGHPLRVRILEQVVLAGEQSPSGIAKALAHPLPTVSKHVRLLRDLGFLELTRTEPRRGAVEHFYRAKQLAYIDDSEWADLPVTLRRSLVWRLFRRIFSEASAAGGVGGFDDPEMHIARYSMELDDLGRREISQVLHTALRQAAGIQRRSDERTGSSDEVRRSTMAMLHYEAADGPAAVPVRPRPAFPDDG